ncbi:DUF1918 domain-containing protein [Streptomyces sp. NPDC046759]|uniref:DUF1918 domain-containing protein n=1 Tax=Streptomyces sp. NPDC046759 TaxID=3155019 RepID=UPI0033E595EA
MTTSAPAQREGRAATATAGPAENGALGRARVGGGTGVPGTAAGVATRDGEAAGVHRRDGGPPPDVRRSGDGRVRLHAPYPPARPPVSGVGRTGRNRRAAADTLPSSVGPEAGGDHVRTE